MLHDQLETHTSVDAKTAEQTLALAIRLQQERGERVSIEELQRTADEAGIDQVYLQAALKQVHEEQQATQQKQQVQATEAEYAPTYRRRVFRGMFIGMIVAIFIVFAGSHGAAGKAVPMAGLAALAMLTITRIRSCRSTVDSPRRRFTGWS